MTDTREGLPVDQVNVRALECYVPSVRADGGIITLTYLLTGGAHGSTGGFSR
jgi:hypothetical protein